MSNASPLNTESTTSERSSAIIRRIDPQYPVRFVGFWTAIIMPFVLLSLVAMETTQQSPELLAGLLAVNVTGLVLGKDYKR